MKLTKRQLKQSIRDEKKKLSEAPVNVRIPMAQEQIEEILNNLWDGERVDNATLIQILEAMISDINNGFIGEPT